MGQSRSETTPLDVNFEKRIIKLKEEIQKASSLTDFEVIATGQQDEIKISVPNQPLGQGRPLCDFTFSYEDTASLFGDQVIPCIVDRLAGAKGIAKGNALAFAISEGMW